MYIFIISTILVTIVGLCFFKKSFWENRYLLLMIIGGVALVATITTNYSVRGNYALIPEVVREKPLSIFYLPSQVATNGIPFQADEDFDFLSSDFSEFHPRMLAFDTVVVQKQIAQDSFAIKIDTVLRHTANLFFYDMQEKEGYRKIGYFRENGKRAYRYWEDVFILPTKDSLAYKATIKLVHDLSNANNNWILKSSIPRRKTYSCFYIPEAEYNAIPDSLIRELPKQL